MKVVALISGGKDSCYNMVLCQQYGHEVVALANLLPPEQETDDLDSWMYQTVGHQLVGAYAQCMGLPLYRRRITGSSADQRLVYEDTEGDEVEDLACLLAFVQQQHPDVTAVSSGAIASDYQRTRVERVCARLGLVSLAYLWHQPQALLLRRMIDSGIDAILVKIAAAGLTPRKHLGARLASLPAQLHALRRLYGCNVCGEGGEYETLTLDCPLFSHGRIILDSWQAVSVSEDSMAPVALLHPTAFHVEPKQLLGGAAEAIRTGAGATSGSGGGTGTVVQVPDDWTPPAPAAAPQQAQQQHAELDVQLSVSDGQQYCSLTASLAPAGAASLDLGSAAGTSAALAAALGRISAALPALGLEWGASLFVHLYVPSMAQFAAANAAYAAVLPAVNPPSRATVQLSGSGGGSGGSSSAAGGSAGAEPAMVVEVLFARQPEGRRVLHVQSISEWAPSCIGPYSQATRHAGLVLFAGQIALDPPIMGVVGGGIDAQCARCLLSCQQVAVAMRTDLPQSLLWCTVYCSEAAGAEGRRRAAEHLAAFVRGDVDTSALDSVGKQQQQQGAEGLGKRPEEKEEAEEEEEEEEGSELELDEYLQPPAMRRHWQPLVTFVTVPELPRGVLVEVQPVACVVDDSLAEESSSSSDSEGEEGSRAEAARRRSERRAALAAARPPGSTMPGWIGRLEQQSGGHVSRLCSPGRLCKVHASVPLPEQQGGAAAADWQQAVRAAAEEAAAALAASELAATDVAACKLYCVVSLLGEAGMTADDLRAAVAGALPGIQPAVVPVTAVGGRPEADAALWLELLAVRA